MKKCDICLVEKPFTDYYPKRAFYMGSCKTCHDKRMGTKTKKCSNCFLVKPLSQFYTKTNTHQSRCKVCNAEVVKSYADKKKYKPKLNKADFKLIDYALDILESDHDKEDNAKLFLDIETLRNKLTKIETK